MDNNAKQRIVYIDILRIIACLSVIFNHTNERGFLRFISDELGSFTWGCNLFVSTWCKSAVPIFFMISGSTLLCKEESVIKTYKRGLKIVADLILFSVIYFHGETILSGERIYSISLLDTMKSIIQSNYWHLWYLYAYIAYIITVPFLKKMVRALDVNTGIYLFICATIIMGVFPIVEYFGISINANLKPSWITYWMFIFPVLGYMIDLKLEKVRSIHILLIWCLDGICFVCGEISQYFFLLREPGNVDERFLINFCIVHSVALFLTVKYIFNKITIKTSIYRLITEIGKSTFGIYLIHIWILWKNPFYDKWVNIEQSSIFGQQGGVYIVVVAVFAIAGALTWTLRRIPIVRKLF